MENCQCIIVLTISELAPSRLERLRIRSCLQWIDLVSNPHHYLRRDDCRDEQVRVKQASSRPLFGISYLCIYFRGRAVLPCGHCSQSPAQHARMNSNVPPCGAKDIPKRKYLSWLRYQLCVSKLSDLKLSTSYTLRGSTSLSHSLTLNSLLRASPDSHYRTDFLVYSDMIVHTFMNETS